MMNIPVKMRTRTVRDILDLGIADDDTVIVIENKSHKYEFKGCWDDARIVDYLDFDCCAFGYLNDYNILTMTLDE